MYLLYTEEEFWQLTPRKLYSQLAVHMDMKNRANGKQPEPETNYIDQIPGW